MDCSPPGSSVHGILWSELLFHSPGDLPDPGIEPGSPVFPSLHVNSLLMSQQEASQEKNDQSKRMGKKSHALVRSYQRRVPGEK